VLFEVTEDVRRLAVKLPPLGPYRLDAIDRYDEVIAISLNRPAAQGARFWVGSEDVPEQSDDRPRDAAGRQASWLALSIGDKGDVGAVGAVQVGSQWFLHSWLQELAWDLEDRGPTPRVSGTPSSKTLHTGRSKTATLVAGELSDGRGGPSSPQVWMLPDPYAWPPAVGSGCARQRLPTASPTSPGGRWVGGWPATGTAARSSTTSAASRPPSGLSSPSPTPGSTGSPNRAHRERASGLTARPGDPVGDGPAVWIDDRRAGAGFAAPTGTLTGAQRVEHRLYVLIDGALWFSGAAPADR
jgi:hypothetical protein